MNALHAIPNAVGMPQPDAVRHTRLVQAAQQFEAVMLGELMKPLSRGTSLDGEGSGDSSNPMQSYGVEAMAGALSKSGALGFAAKMVHSIEAKKRSESTQVPPAHADIQENEDQL